MIEFGGGGGSAGGAAAFVHLASVVAVGGENVLSLTELVQTASDLIIVASINGSGVDQVAVTFNGDTGNNYDYQQGLIGYMDNQPSIEWLYVFPVGVSPNYFPAGTMEVFKYSKADRWKMLTTVYVDQTGSSLGDTVASYLGGKWRSDAPITRLDFTLGGGGTYTAGSTFDVYGRGAAS